MNTIKYHLSCDGNVRGLFSSEEEAYKFALKEQGWTDEELEADYDFYMKDCRKYGTDPLSPRGGISLYFIYEIELSETGELLKIDGMDFEDYIQETYDAEWGELDKEKIVAYWTDKELELFRRRNKK